MVTLTYFLIMSVMQCAGNQNKPRAAINEFSNVG